MRRIFAIVLVLLWIPVAAWSAGPLYARHTEPMDGANGFPASCHVSENPHSTPVGCGTPAGSSDAAYESSAYHYFVASGSYTDTPLPPGGCMDIREFWVSWDNDWMYLGVQGPNELYERGDLFVAIDVDNLTGAGVGQSAPWGKAVDFCDWRPDFFVAVENPQSAGGYAALLDQGHGTILDSFTGLQWADGGYRSCDDYGMYYEFKLPLGLLGIPAGTPRQVNFALYTTYEDEGFDAYDSGPGCGQPAVWEQIGDYPYDSDHCGGDLDCWTGTNDGSCGFPDSDDNNGAGNAIGGRYPASDNSGFERDTIREYYAIANFGEPPIAVSPARWSSVKVMYR